MRRFLLALSLALCSVIGYAQDPNPQGGFVSTLLSAKPSLYLNFNDATTNFVEQVSGDTFVQTATVTEDTVAPSAFLGTVSAYYTTFSTSPFPISGNLTTVKLYFYAAPTIGQTVEMLIGTLGSGTNLTINATFNITITSAATGWQTYSVTPVAVTSGQVLGDYVNGSSIPPAYGTAVGGYSLYSLSGTPPATGTPATYTQISALMGIQGVVASTQTSGTVTPHQPGFDSTLLNNTSAEFAWNAWNAAPNNTLGAIDWSTPWTLLKHIDRFEWDRTGTVVLASKGDLATNTFWELYLQPATNIYYTGGTVAQLCFERRGASSLSIGSGYLGSKVCTTPGLDALANGFNYDIVVTDSGTGRSGDGTYGGGTPALTLYVNGLTNTDLPTTATSTSFQYGFGAVTLTVSGGTGYANPTAFTSTGGGANCVVAGNFATSGGVPTGAVTYTYSGGCTSTPTIVLTAPTGTGITVTPSAPDTASMNSASPLMVPGFISAGTFYGVGGSDSSLAPIYADEFAIFPGVLTAPQIQGLFYWTKFYQSMLDLSYPAKAVLLLANDGCTDVANIQQIQTVLALSRINVFNIEGLLATGLGNGSDTYDLSAPIYRQMLDESGLAGVPLGVLYAGSSPSDTNWCANANIATYNASTPIPSTAYPSTTAIARTVLAQNPTTPVIIYQGSPWQWVSDFLQSSADGISSLTGQQLWNRDVTNGGSMLFQDQPECIPSASPNPLPCSNSFSLLDPLAAEYTFQHLNGMPVYEVGGTPQQSGQGLVNTRTSKDPMYLACLTQIGLTGTCNRFAWGEYSMMDLISSYFSNGVSVSIGGTGTGYADQTYFTSTGGGTNCHVAGIMISSGGEPTGAVTTLWGLPLPLTADEGMLVGLGSGCTSAPTLVLTAPTGTGATLTAYPLSVCGTSSATSTTYSFSSTTCGTEHFIPFSQWALQGATPIYAWFLNSLVNPPPVGRPLAP